MKAVFYGVGAFLLIGLWLFILAYQLIPTDLGNSYLIGSFLFVVGAGLLAGMAFVGKAIIREIKSLVSNPMPRVIESEPVVTLPQIPISVPAPTPEEKTVTGKAAIVATGAAAAAAGAVAGGLLGGVTRQEAGASESLAKHEDRFLDDLERDLFADIDKNEPKLGPAPREAMAMADEPATLAGKAMDVDDVGLMVEPDEIDDEAQEAVKVDASGSAPDDAPEDVAEDDDADTDDMLDEEEPGMPASAPGLIADADLAALQDEAPMLAPLETLDVVGAYDSGGTRFTMYSDGSVTALGEDVDRRFKSLDDLRAFIDGGMRS